MIGLLITLAVVAIVLVVAWYIIRQFPLPDPLDKIVTIAFVVIVAIVVIWLLLSIPGVTPHPLLR